MRRFIVNATAGFSLAGCSSLPSMPSASFDPFAEPPRYVQLQLESMPAGAEARTSTGQACTTPCATTLTNPENGLQVTYALNGFQPTTVPVQITRMPSGFWSWGTTTANPNPVFAQLQPVPPPPPSKPVRKMRPKRPPPPPAPSR